MTAATSIPGTHCGEPGSGVVTLAGMHRHATARLAQAGLDTPALDARLLIAHALRCPRSVTLTDPDRRLGDDEVRTIAALIERRLHREPVSRILGHRSFYGLDLEISAATLDPRPDTETLVDEALRLVRAGELPGDLAPRIADLGTGSGAIVIALLHALPRATGLATDIDPAALATARRNAEHAGVAQRLEAVCTSWLDAVAGPFDLIVSNPPYIETDVIDRLEPEVRDFDPRRALDGGPDGLAAYRALVPQALAKVAPGGVVLLEVGIEQAEKVSAIAAACAGSRLAGPPRVIADLTRRPRCVALRARY